MNITTNSYIELIGLVSLIHILFIIIKIDIDAISFGMKLKYPKSEIITIISTVIVIVLCFYYHIIALVVGYITIIIIAMILLEWIRHYLITK